MKQQKIYYQDVMDLGFSETVCSDPVYERQHGYKYCIYTLYLNELIYLDWEKSTKLCQIVRLKPDDPDYVAKRMPIIDLKQLKAVVKFFKD